MLYGYSIVQGIADVRARIHSAGAQKTCPLEPVPAGDWHRRAGLRESATAFPPRYGGAFGRQPADGSRSLERRDALSVPARAMLERELGREAAERMIAVVERMAAAAGAHDDPAPPG